jgi:serine phosphatase RsbU (regulator of sigma subunit)
MRFLIVLILLYSVFLQSYGQQWSRQSVDSLVAVIRKTDKKAHLEYPIDAYIVQHAKSKDFFEYFLQKTANQKDLVELHGKVNVAFAQYYYLREKKDIDFARQYYKKAEEYLRKNNHPCDALEVWLSFADQLTQQNLDVELAKQILENTYEKARQEDCRTVAIRTEYVKGIYLGERQGKYKKSLEQMLKAEQLITPTVPHSVKIEVYDGLGFLFYKASNYDKALQYWLKVDTLLKTLNYDDKYPVTKVLNNIGLVYKNKDNQEKALEFYQKAIQVATQRKDTFWMNLPKGNIGDIFFARKQIDTAYQLYQQYLSVAYKFQDWGIVVAGHTKLANYFIEKGLYKEAKREIETAQKFLDAKKAFIFIDNATLGATAQKNIYRTLSILSQRERKFDEAVFYQNKYIAINDSINKLISAQQLELLSVDLKVQQEVIEKEKLKENIRQREILVFAFLATTLLSLLLVALVLWNRYQIQKQGLLVKKKNEEIALVNDILEGKNKDIMDSILYAERIQKAFLPKQTKLSKILENYFVLYKPKNIVSGDFYYVVEKEDTIFIVAADCTGHGVPGALMSMLGVILLDNIIREKGIQSPAKIVEMLDKGIIQTLHQEESESQDGMDIAVCVWHKKDRILKIAGAKTSVILINGGVFEEIITDRYTVGGDGARYLQQEKKFLEIERHVSENAMLYLFSDGYIDQFSSANRKKMGKKRLYQAFLMIQNQDMTHQFNYLNNMLVQWQGEEEQIDDILVMGIRL